MVTNYLKEALNNINEEALLSNESFVIADYGCAGGGNSLPLFDPVIQFVRSKNPSKKIIIYLNDIPVNDFDITLRTVRDHFPTDKNIEPIAVKRSFFDQVLPDNTVDIGFCFTAAHWLSKHPGLLPGYSMGGSFIPDQEVKENWSA